jgi:hypothetical protein
MCIWQESITRCHRMTDKQGTALLLFFLRHKSSEVDEIVSNRRTWEPVPAKESAVLASTSIASERPKPRRTELYRFRVHCSSLLRTQTDSVALISPDSADSSAFAEQSASFLPFSCRLAVVTIGPLVAV